MSPPLLPGDPSTIGGHRILARLGAGGMGVVYLGRAPGGTLAAVKVVHQDLADEPGFRLRFQREIEAARRVESAWVSPVTAAGPDDAPAPWLATAFVPGPSLGEAVQRFGPLPERSVGRLGHLLAAALGQVHAAGLVHRDVKPANVLLAVDGPRLIDFGIARSPDATALTTAGAVAGSPGFLSPEQARAGELGPASDVFSLGCLLAHALTGRPPFGHGTPEAILYRTVHEEPDLGGPEPEEARSLLAVVRACLAKEPAARPGTVEIGRRLAADRTGGEDWLPGPVLRHIAETTARMLALPDIEPTAAGTPGLPVTDTAVDGTPSAAGAAPPATPPTPPHHGRRRALLSIAGAAAAVAAGGGLWALTRDDGSAAGSGDTRWALGVHADLSGPGKAVGRALEQGARLAVEQYNARASRPFELDLRTSDDRGSEGRAKAAAERLVADRGVLAVIGPNTSQTAVASLATYDAAMLPLLFVVPGTVWLRTEHSRTAVHCRAPDFSVAYEIAYHLAMRTKARRIGLLQDRTAAAYGWEVSAMTSEPLHDAGLTLHPRVAPAGLVDFRPLIDDLMDDGIDSYIHAGYADSAARAARDLADAEFTGRRMGTQTLLDPRFLDAAGAAAEGWLITASCIDPSAVPAAAPFRKAYRRRFGREPGYYAAEAYDTANLTIRRLTGSARDGRPPSRRRLVPLLRGAEYQGITKKFAFEADTGHYSLEEGVSLYEVKDGKFRFVPVKPREAEK
ncbi:Serine/threonine-protein kinase AfsK [Streptomyces sp. YIM 130001]|uniref:bifunctional serine/threonine-protein kinase/ABC transporter substrate-binding protein n=1 Tax=Streptomyces sp. YIM 130001 TaxID=2259644 RepID=UPI000E64D01E|nr:bifunctional serine/threonine-protein kinase/ABC transporter substrate-binding protein [Streptomyces sp. YIM 130001]RII17852.1 Serine/threonine-protein kinase AfsK [Streptomyces sp. YIM 130001]